MEAEKEAFETSGVAQKQVNEIHYELIRGKKR